MAKTYAKSYSDAWGKLGLHDKRRLFETFPRFEKKDFDELKQDYVKEFGYHLVIPRITDIFHLIPDSWLSPEALKAEKTRRLMNILSSPLPEWAQAYTSIMTWMDNIQDAGSVVYPVIGALARWSPKIFSRFIPAFGWLMLGTDILQFLIGLGRLPLNPFAGKRLMCDFTRLNPFSKTERYYRQERVRNYRPSFADALQAAQTADQVLGVGLSLGAIAGLIMGAPFLAYRYATGERVSVSFDVPDLFEHEKQARRAMIAAAILNASGQTFADLDHFWSMTIGAVAARTFAPVVNDYDIAGSIDRPWEILVPAERCWNKSTREIIQEQGLDVEQGERWPFNTEKQIPMGELNDSIIAGSRNVFRDYFFRHQKDWYGYVAARLWDQVTPPLILSFDPEGSMEMDDTPMMKAAFSMAKAPMLPDHLPSQENQKAFVDWIEREYHQTKQIPGVPDIKSQLLTLGFGTREEYPSQTDPQEAIYWPPDAPWTDYTFP